MSAKSNITLILGGARSGKSSPFLATAQALDEEMSTRIQKHRLERPAGWETLEISCDVASHVPQIKSDVVILDCVTLLVSNLLMQFVKEDLVDEKSFMLAVQKEVEGLIAGIREQRQDWLIISNEVGLGLVPPYPMGRIYRDVLGWANQRLAREADHVIFMVAGIPMMVK
jgi:adenosylcobinamide kinase / adenosylcobinamide-phosphate guanylyltransferase